jgi:hypothetical protein
MMRAMNTSLPRAVLALSAIALMVAPATAEPAKKYHFELTKVLAKENVKADVAQIAQQRVEAQVKKQFEANPQLVAVDDAPDPKTSADAYRRYLEKKGISGAYLVTVEITQASQELEPMPDKANTQRLVVHLGLHVLGETIPGQTMGFTGDGHATVKEEVDLKVRDKDRDYAWDSAAETSVTDAIKKCFEQLAKGTPKQHN